MGIGSGRVKSATKHKIIRKKRDNKRDLRRAAKAMKGAGMKVRSKKTREQAKLALRISNANPDKEDMLRNLLQSRDKARVVRGDKKAQRKEEALRAAAAAENGEEVEEGEEDEEFDEEDSEEDFEQLPAVGGGNKSRLVFPNQIGSNFKAQFPFYVSNYVFPTQDADERTSALPSAVLVTVDVRAGVQSLPWSLVDYVVEAAKDAEAAAKGKKGANKHSVLLLITATKVDLVSAQALGTTMALLSEAIYLRYADAGGIPASIKVAFAPFSYEYDKTGKHILSILRNFASSIHSDESLASTKAVSANKSNMKDKLCVAILGFPSTGRRTLGKSLVQVGSDSAVSVAPARTLQYVSVPVEKSDEADQKRKRKEVEEDEEEQVKTIVANAKQMTLIIFPEDVDLARRAKAVTSGDIILHSFSFIEKLGEPETVASLIAETVVDKVSLCQTFSLPLLISDDDEHNAGAMNFLKRLGTNLRRDKGFCFASPLLAGSGTAGKVTASNLTASTNFAARQDSSRPSMISAYSGAIPGKVVRVSWNKGDTKNSLRLGARAFLKEWHSGRHIPWAILRPFTDEKHKKNYVAAVEAQKRCIFDTSLLPVKAVSSAQAATKEINESFNKNIAALAYVTKDYLALLPHSVVEVAPHAVVPEQHNLAE